MWRVVAVASILAIVVPVQGQVTSCGDGFELFIRNPDVAPSQDGKFHVSGDMFVQFQVIGPNADEIEAFGFSVGLPPENPEQMCDLPVWPAGLMLEAYKVDLDKDDGFFIFVNTKGQATPQAMDLQVAVHGYDADGTELARFWGIGIVESCPGPGPGGCEGSDQNDDVMPWPVILPGDGTKTYVDGFTVEFSEALESARFWLNAVDITDQMQPWEGRLWDSDVFYDYGPAGVFATAAPMCTLPEPIQECDKSPGPAFQWTQRTITEDDVIRVEAVDMFGNIARKEIHVGSSVAGGTIADGLPILTMTFDTAQMLVPAGGTAVFRARVENTGGGTGHPLAAAEVPEGWGFEWVPGHKPVEPATQEFQELNIMVPKDAEPGIYSVNATMSYQQGQKDRTLRSMLEVLVDGSPRATNESQDDTGAARKESPSLGPIVLPMLVAAALRRRLY